MNLLIKLKRWLYLLTRGRYASALIRSGTFAGQWYAEEYCGTSPHLGFPLYHYIRYGRREGKAPHPLFDPDWYRAINGLRSDTDPALHYINRLEHGEKAFPNATLEAIARLPGGWEFSNRFSLRASSPLKPNHIPVTIEDGFDGTREREFLQHLAPLGSSSHPLVSIIMPTRNRARSLMEAIDSVLAQGYENWELIVIDDGSTDNTAEMLGRLVDKRIRAIKTVHGGAAAARNLGLASATGAYIAYLDSDNRWKPHFLDSMVRFLLDRQLDAAYCAIHYHAAGSSGYIGRPMCIDDLSWMNFVDLNAFVHARRLLDHLGNFDTGLRRMIDWDLVLRYARASRVEFAPFVGVDYDAGERADRISLSESTNWYNVVIAKDRLDWDEARTAAGERSPSLLSVIIVVSNKRECSTLDLCIESLLREKREHPDVEVIVVDNQVDAVVSNRIALWASAFPSIRRLRNRHPVGIALSLNLGFMASHGARVVFMQQPAVLSGGGVSNVQGALAARRADAIQGKVLGADGAIYSIGVTFVAGSLMGSPLCRGFSADDPVVGNPRPVTALSAAFLAMGADTFIDLHGFDSLYVAECFDWDISVRLRQAGLRCGYEPAASIRLSMDPTQSGLVSHWDRELFGARRENVIGSEVAAVEQDALFVTDYVLDALPCGRQELAVFVPIAYRRNALVQEPVLHLSVGIHVASPWRERENWGDHHFAVALAAGLEHLGYNAEVVYPDHADTACHAVRLVLRGLAPVKPRPESLNILWVISHPGEVEAGELESFDHVFAASLSYTARYKALLGDRISPLLQCTDPRHFNPHLVPVSPGEDVLFVGNSRGVMREVISMSLAAGIEPCIYGGGWEGLVPARIIKGRYIPNSQLGQNYRAATVVLNDHWQDMAQEGFISNRVFDVLACGGVLVSDRVPGMAALFGDACLTYTDRDSLLNAVREARRNPAARREKAMEAADRIMHEHTFAMRAQEIHSVIQREISRRRNQA